MTYKIEDGIPVPAKNAGKSDSKLGATLRAMAIGQSALIDDKKRGTIVQAARAIGREIGGLFQIEPEGEHFRVFRVPGVTPPVRPHKPGAATRKPKLVAAE